MFLNWKPKKVAVAPAAIYFLEESMTKDARIGFSTKEFMVNTQQVLAALAQTGNQLRLHRTSRFASWMPDWLPYSMAETWIKVNRLSWMPSPKQQTVLLDEHKGLFIFLVFRRSLSPLLCIFDLILTLWGICKVKNGFRYKCSEKCVCRIMFRNNHEYK